MAATTALASDPAARAGLSREQLLELYYWMRLTRSLEERLVNLYRQTKVVGGLFRSLGQEADAVGSAFALEKGDVLYLTQAANGVTLTPYDPSLESQIEAGREFMRQYRDTFHQLAK